MHVSKHKLCLAQTERDQELFSLREQEHTCSLAGRNNTSANKPRYEAIAHSEEGHATPPMIPWLLYSHGSCFCCNIGLWSQPIAQPKEEQLAWHSPCPNICFASCQVRSSTNREGLCSGSFMSQGEELKNT
eukprot:1224523-Amphidinium_carterae.1